MLKSATDTVSGAAQMVWQKVNKTHIDSDERQELMNAYRKREYKSFKFSKAERDAERTSYQTAKETRLPQPVLEGHRAANQARRALLEQRLNAAEELAKKGIAGSTEGSAHTRTVMANVRRAQRRYDHALLNLQRIAPGELRSRESYELEMALHVLKGHPEAALAVTDRAKKQFGTDEPFKPMRIQMQLQRNEVDLAWEEHARCKEEALSANIRKECAAVVAKVKRPGEDGTGAAPGSNLIDNIKTLF